LRVGYAARREHESAGADPKLLLADPEEVFAVKDEEQLVFSFVDMQRSVDWFVLLEIVNAPAVVSAEALINTSTSPHRRCSPSPARARTPAHPPRWSYCSLLYSIERTMPAMASEGKRRPYEMSNRARQARETRRRIVDAAAQLFLREGYSATSINAIAREAGVAVPTVYASLRSKANILRAVVELTVRGDDESTPLASRAAWHQIERQRDPHEQLRAFARLHRQIADREAALFAQLDAAAGGDPEATQLLAEHEELRHQTQSRLAETLERRDQLKPGLTTREAADSIWTLASERTYLALVRDRRWTPANYERWLVGQLAAALLPP
jgi:TetR/AcrR family transcriptional regulator, regulator of autoinduction and epiphytic fitness